MSIQWTNRFWSVSLEHTLFLDFLKLFVNMRLAVSFAGRKKCIFWTYRSKVMDVWSFKEKSGRAGMYWSQWRRVDHMCKFLGAGGRRKGAGGIQKRRIRARAVGRHRPLPNQQLLQGRRPLVARLPGNCSPQRVATSSHPLAVNHRLNSWAQSFFFGFLFFKVF
jgi:hypothetical protein